MKARGPPLTRWGGDPAHTRARTGRTHTSIRCTRQPRTPLLTRPVRAHSQCWWVRLSLDAFASVARTPFVHVSRRLKQCMQFVDSRWHLSRSRGGWVGAIRLRPGGPAPDRRSQTASNSKLEYPVARASPTALGRPNLQEPCTQTVTAHALTRPHALTPHFFMLRFFQVTSPANK